MAQDSAPRLRPKPQSAVPSTGRMTVFARVGGLLRRRFIAGLIALSPFVFTFLVIRFLFNLSDGLIQPVIEEWLGREVPGLGLAILLLLTLVAGFVAINLLGRRLFWAIETLVLRVPVIGPVFAVSQQLVDSFGATAETGFSRVVEIEYPRRGLWVLGFLTDTVEHEDGSQLGVVFIPTTPTPSSGWLALVPVADIYDVDMSANEAMRAVLSAGVAMPTRITRTPASSAAP